MRFYNQRHKFYLLKTIPGVGQILALTILYEVHDIERFKTVQRFCSYPNQSVLNAPD